MKNIILILLLLLSVAFINAEDFGFGFGDSESAEDSGSAFSFGNTGINLTIGGNTTFALRSFFNEFPDGMDHIHIDGICGGELDFTVSGTIADAVLKLKLKPVFDPNISKDNLPLALDELYLRAYIGEALASLPLTIEAGLRKITWGKADSLGPLDVVNVLDFSDLSKLSDIESIRLATPLVHLIFALGNYSKLEGVFVPGYIPPPFPAGRWLTEDMASLAGYTVIPPDSSTVDYAQGGLRFSSTLGRVDYGLQYYYGRLSTPALVFVYPDTMHLNYNSYHQLGVDYAQVLAGFNVRAEAAVNLTSDSGGSDGAVYNPYFAWSLGFDRNLFVGINLNAQGTGKVRFNSDKISNIALSDIEADTNDTSTRLIASLSRSFIQDELTLKLNAICDIEDSDYLLAPSAKWQKDSLSIEALAGFFGGSKDGELGQYKDNSFIKLSLTYMF